MPKSIYDESVGYAVLRTLAEAELRPVLFKCVRSIFYNFFFRQYRAALLRGKKTRVSSVDHPLDAKIPFVPAWVTIYLDFVTFWVRIISFLLRCYGRRAFDAVKEFLSSMGRLYAYAAEVYQKNFSTTKRPFYIARPRFFLIHLVDPHLMCIPSLHVMVAIRTYTLFTRIMNELGGPRLAGTLVEEIRQGALAITRAVLYVKQHSVNCIAAALYAMTCFDPELFPPEEADIFTGEIFFGRPPPEDAADRRLSNFAVRPAAAPGTAIEPADARAIREHIAGLYRRFLREKEQSQNWSEPLLRFLRETRDAGF